MNKTKPFRFLTSKGFLMLIALFLLIIILTFFFGDGGIVEIVTTQNRISQLEQRIESLKKEKATLEKEIQELKNNPLALEKRAREKLWLMKKNEKVVVLVEEKGDRKGKNTKTEKDQ